MNISQRKCQNSENEQGEALLHSHLAGAIRRFSLRIDKGLGETCYDTDGIFL